LTRGRFIYASLLVSICLGLYSGAAVAAPGDVDRTFGQEGAVLLPVSQDGYATPVGMAVAPDDAIYVLRESTNCRFSWPCQQEILVSRLRPNGSLDTGFGQGGTASAWTMPLQYGLGPSAALAVGQDGKTVVAVPSGKELILVRLDSAGRVDASFGTGGVARAAIGIEVDRLRVSVDKTGSIVVAAEAGFAARELVVAVARYTPQGTPDSTFNGGAAVVTDIGSGLGGFAVGEDGQVVVAGPRCCELGGRSVHLARLTEKGAFDSGFGPRGQRFVDDVAPGAAVGGVVFLRNGRIIVAGTGKDGRAFALRLRPDGRLDRHFGSQGIAHAKAGFSGETGDAIDGHGRLLIAGTVQGGSGQGQRFQHLALLRRLSDGHRDWTFGGGGLVGLRGAEVSSFVAIQMQSDERILVLVAGGNCERVCSTPKTKVIRYLGGTSGARCLGRKATIVGTRNADKLIGTPRRDVIAAQAGNDVVRGRGGNDLICGGRGNDRLLGGGGRDQLLGGAGRNQIAQ
jgi:uncharacterized delta-60 repeat protein